MYSKKSVYLCKLKAKYLFYPKNDPIMEMKDRIRRIMEEQHMSQQVFADFIGLSAATLSSIFNGRTRPTLNIVEAIKKKIPSINTDWLLMGIGDMHVEVGEQATDAPPVSTSTLSEPMLDFTTPAPERTTTAPIPTYPHSVQSTRMELRDYDTKKQDKEPRKVTEIRVYYDDQTYETFVEK